MALVLLNSGAPPLGQFDCVDSEVTTFLGGEICTWYHETFQGSDEASADVNQDGYVGTSSKTRPAVSKAQLTNSSKPLFLADDGTLNYGTLFGEVVGATVGQQSVNGVVLGPHTSTGSGKTTLWDKPGLYGVTLDAVDTATDGLVPSNPSLSVGTQLTYTLIGSGGKGLLTPVASTNSNSNTVGVARLAEFSTNGSLVTTPNFLVAALNSPSGDVTSLQQQKMYMAVVWFAGSAAGA